MARWGNAYNYRLRLNATRSDKGETQLVLPEQVTDMVGAEPGDEFLCIVTADGGILLRKLEQ